MTTDRPGATASLRTAGIIATWFGAGLLPKAPGTWGSLAALPFAWVIVALGGTWALAVAAILATLVGTWAAEKYAAALGQDDPGRIVIDEVAGQWLALLPITVVSPAAGGLWWAAAFLAFRLFDITKPWPARRFEKLHGGLGIMADDIVAGVYAAVAVTAALVLFS